MFLRSHHALPSHDHPAFSPVRMSDGAPRPLRETVASCIPGSTSMGLQPEIWTRREGRAGHVSVRETPRVGPPPYEIGLRDEA